MLIVFSFFYALLFLISFFIPKKAIFFFWIAIILYPHQLFNFIPGGINLYDIYLIILFIIILLKNNFILKTNEIVYFSLVYLFLIPASELISQIIIQQNFNYSNTLLLSRGIIKISEYFIIASITTNTIKSYNINKGNLINTFFISIAALSIIGFLQILGINLINIFYNVDTLTFLDNFNRSTGSTKGPWIMGALTAFSGIILLNIIIEGPRKYKFTSIVLFAITLTGLILTRSRASWLMFFSALPLFLYYSKHKLKFIIISIIGLLILINIPFLYEIILYRIQYTFTFGQNDLDNSSFTRIMQWKEIIKNFNFNYLFTGYGMHSTQQLIGWHTPHNAFFAILLFNGLFGIVFFNVLYYRVLKNLNIIIKHEFDEYLKSIWKGTFIALISLLVYSLTADTFYSYLIMLTFFFFASIVTERKRELLSISETDLKTRSTG